MLNLDGEPASADVVESMLRPLAHRGPDGAAVHVDGPAALGHARLSIIDLEGGWQPLFNEDRTVALVCNGEIYNFPALREELMAKGHQFRTGSDCEVIVHLWEEHGPSCVERLRGMFAFMLWDAKQQRLFGARDRFGQKPLYFHRGERRLSFASEIKSLLTLPEVEREVDPVALDQFLFYQFVPHPRTMFQGVYQVPPACRLSYGNDELEIERYWQPSFRPDHGESDGVQLERIGTAVEDAVVSHMISDVPVGLFLSGGIDSSLLLAIASAHAGEPLSTFSVSFPESRYDEADFARIAAKRFGSRHHEFPLEPQRIRHYLERTAEIFDRPLADSAVLPLLCLSERAAEHVRVVLTGDGGDELFGGYRKYRRATAIPGRLRWVSRYGARFFRTEELAASVPDPLGLRKFRSRVGLALVPPKRSTYNRLSWEGWDRYELYTPESRSRLQAEFSAADIDLSVEPLDPLNDMLRVDQGSYLADDLLLKTDHATMAYGLEARAPLLDHELAGAAGRLPLHLKVTPHETKVALRRIAERYLPSELTTRRKKGFSFPLRDWFRDELSGWLRQTLVVESVAIPRHFDRRYVARVIDEHVSGRRDHVGRLYSLLTFELWFRRYMRSGD